MQVIASSFGIKDRKWQTNITNKVIYQKQTKNDFYLLTDFSNE